MMEKHLAWLVGGIGAVLFVAVAPVMTVWAITTNSASQTVPAMNQSASTVSTDYAPSTHTATNAPLGARLNAKG